jgi:hypothetical protein
MRLLEVYRQLQSTTVEYSPMKASQDLHSGGFALKPCWTCEEGQHY